MIKLPFAGVKGETDPPSRIQVQVPWKCMANMSSQEVRGWFKDPGLEDMGLSIEKRSIFSKALLQMIQKKITKIPIRFIIGPQTVRN